MRIYDTFESNQVIDQLLVFKRQRYSGVTEENWHQTRCTGLGSDLSVNQTYRAVGLDLKRGVLLSRPGEGLLERLPSESRLLLLL
jgi:hypothetical protein